MWQKVLSVAEMADGQTKTVFAGDKTLALFKQAGKFYALNNSCMHRGGPLGEGHVDGEEVICPWHAWNINIKTGHCEISGQKQPSYPVKTENGDVWVDV